tara:strand:- start:376 stop:825 length:450 start_codon:yes stop_codon:yes gene_type:complete
MEIDAKYLETLRKFNNGKNADVLENDLPPGTYPINMTVTIEGQLKKGENGTSNRRSRAGIDNVLQYLLDRINESTYNCLVRDLDAIRKGNFKVKNGQARFDGRLSAVMPYREIQRSGSTKFDGIITIEDVDIYDNPMTEKGLTVTKGGE